MAEEVVHAPPQGKSANKPYPLFTSLLRKDLASKLDELEISLEMDGGSDLSFEGQGTRFKLTWSEMYGVSQGIEHRLHCVVSIADEEEFAKVKVYNSADGVIIFKAEATSSGFDFKEAVVKAIREKLQDASIAKYNSKDTAAICALFFEPSLDLEPDLILSWVMLSNALMALSRMLDGEVGKPT